MFETGKEKIVGILGGMGPEATIDLMARILKLTPVADDIDHIHCIVDNNPKVPSRIKAIIDGTGESPAPCMADMARKLEAGGADFLVIPCNTAHFYHRDVQAAVRIPVLNLIELTAREVVETLPGVSRVGLLASPAVRITRLYEAVFQPMGIKVVYPDHADETRLFAVIKDIKTGARGPEIRETIGGIMAGLAALGAEAGIVACTELSVVPGVVFSMPAFDAADILAKEVVAIVKGGKTLRRKHEQSVPA